MDIDSVPSLTPRHTARIKKWARLSAQWIWRALLTLAVLMALTALLLHFWIVPRLGDWKDDLAAWLGEQTGLELRIGSMQVQSHGLWARVEMRGIEATRADGHRVLSVAKTEFGLSSRSIWAMGVDYLHFDQMVLELGRNRGGQFTVAGLAIDTQRNASNPMVNWLLQQPRVVLQQGRLTWRDELGQDPRARTAPAPIDWLHQVELESTHSGLLQHELRAQATPANASWGDRLSLSGQFKEPLLSTQGRDPSTWQGSVRVQAPRLALDRWLPFSQAQWPLNWQGEMALEAHLRLDEAQLLGAEVQVQAPQLQLSWAQGESGLDLRQVQGRVTYLKDKNSSAYGLKTNDLSFAMPSGERWPSTSMGVNWQLSPDGTLRGLTLQAQDVDLSVLSQLAQLTQWTQLAKRIHPDAAHWAALRQLKIDGQLDHLNLSWQQMASTSRPTFSLKASGQRLKWAAQPQGAWGLNWIPGLQGGSADLVIQEGEGRLKLDIQNGELDLPGVWSEPKLAVRFAELNVQWRGQGNRWDVNVGPSQLETADLKGRFQAHWKRDASTSALGHLQMNADIEEALAQRVHRYLPSRLPKEALDYVQQSIRSGKVTQAQLRLKGDLDRFPFTGRTDEHFEVKAKLQDLTYHYIPTAPSLLTQTTQTEPSAQTAWPGFSGLRGDFEISGASMSVRNASAKVVGHPDLNWRGMQAHIADLSEPVVQVGGLAQADLAALLALVQQSPLSPMLDHALREARGSGRAQLDLRLRIPVHQPDRTTLVGKLSLDKVSLGLSESVPVLTQLTGDLAFTENRLQIATATAQALGGEARIQGGLAFSPQAFADVQRPTALQISGLATAQGMRSQSQVAWLAPLAAHLEGSTRYAMRLSVRSGQLNWMIDSDMVGLSTQLPSPLNKATDQAWPLRVEWSAQSVNLPSRNTGRGGTKGQPSVEPVLSVQVGKVLKAQYLLRTLASGYEPVSAQLVVGDLAHDATMASAGTEVSWRVQLNELQWEPWQAALGRMLKTLPVQKAAYTAGAPSSPVNVATGASWWPTQVSVHAERVYATGRLWRAVELKGQRKRATAKWDLALKAEQFQGAGQYVPARAEAPAELSLQLQRLLIPAATGPELDQAVASLDSVQQMPAFKVSVQSLNIKGKAWGRVDIDAVQRVLPQGGRVWQLQRFDLTLPEAQFKAKGDWNPQRQPQQTRLDFTLDIQDGGALLSRLGMPNVLRATPGKLEGNMGWQSTPLSPQLKTMSGQFNMNMERGQFLKSEPGVARLLGILSLQALPRRLALDFRDVFSQGFAFDYFRGDVLVEKGVARSSNLQMKGVAAGVFMQGWANVHDETHDLKVVVVPEINAGTASLVYSTINPWVGITSFFAQYVLRKPLIQANTDHLHIYGTWSQPIVDTVEPETGKVISSTREKTP